MKVGFVHITKTGGSNFKRKNTNRMVICKADHHDTAKTYNNKNNPCFAIIREPLDRFISAFKFNVAGSDKWKKEFHIKNVNDFVDEMKKSPVAFLNTFDKGMQFKKQVKWLNGDPNRTYVVKYSKDSLVDDIIYLLDREFDIDYAYDKSSKDLNVSFTKNVDVNISDENKKYVLDYYKEDVDLYEKLDNYTRVHSTNYAKLSSLGVDEKDWLEGFTTVSSTETYYHRLWYVIIILIMSLISVLCYRYIAVKKRNKR
jgi:hypothetical protein